MSKADQEGSFRMEFPPLQAGGPFILHVKGEQDENMEAHLIEGTVSASKVKELSHKNNTSVGVMVTALYIAAVIDEMSVREKNNNIIAVSVL